MTQDSCIILIENLCSNLVKTYLPSDLNEHSLLKKKFLKKSKDHFWDLIIFNKENKR